MSHVSPRHVRHRKRSRLRRSVDFKAFLAALQAVLNATGAAAVFTCTAVVLTAASRILTSSAIANGDTVTVGGKTYTFQDTLTNVANNVKRSGTLATDLANLAAAINAGAGSGTAYAALTVANANVSAVSDATTLTATALVAGAAGNAIVCTETSGTSAWASGTLTGGLDAVQPAFITKATHGFDVGDGPFLASNSGGALPSGLVIDTLYWAVSVPTANTLGLSTSRNGAAITLTTPGTGTNTLTKASSLDAVFQLLKRYRPETVVAATDVDTL